MQVILLEKIRNLGSLGDQVNVKPGYGRNFLIPQGKAVSATKENIAHFEARRAELEAKAEAALNEAKTRLEAIQALEGLTISAKAGDEGKLFGSIGPNDIAQALSEAGESTQVAKSEVQMPYGAIRNTGEYDIDVQLHSDVVGTISVNVVPQ